LACSPHGDTVQPPVSLPIAGRISSVDELLEQLAARLNAAEAIAQRIARAGSVTVAHVVKKRVAAHPVSAAFLADDARARRYVRDEHTGPTMLIRVVEIEVDSWLVGGAAAAVTVVWPATVINDPRTAVLPAVGDAGIVFLAPHPDDTLGRELAAAFPGSYGIAGESRLVHAESSDEQRAAFALWGRADIADAARAVPTARGELLQLALDVLVRAGEPGRRWLERLRSDADLTRALLVRAALWRQGAHQAAADGLSPATLDRDVLSPLGVARVERAGVERFAGPSKDTPIAW
jgi:hypothetical protein